MKCKKCKTRWADDGHELCAACEFQPQTGKLPPRYQKHKGLPSPTGESAEDDYGDESNADSIYIEANDRRTLGRKCPT